MILLIISKQAILALTYIEIKVSAWNIDWFIAALLSRICHSHYQLSRLKCRYCSLIWIEMFHFMLNAFKLHFSLLRCYIDSFCLVYRLRTCFWWYYCILHIWFAWFIGIDYVLDWRIELQNAFYNLLITL